MRLIVAAVGRLKAGPERALCERYGERIRGLLRPLGISELKLVEIAESGQRQAPARMREEATALKAQLPVRTTLILFDERGKTPTSPAFAAALAEWRAAGTECLCFAIGGPDGFDPAFRADAAGVMSFGAMTMPHQLVRALVLEQIYRAGTILTGHPYHRN